MGVNSSPHCAKSGSLVPRASRGLCRNRELGIPKSSKESPCSVRKKETVSPSTAIRWSNKITSGECVKLSSESLRISGTYLTNTSPISTALPASGTARTATPITHVRPQPTKASIFQKPSSIGEDLKASPVNVNNNCSLPVKTVYMYQPHTTNAKSSKGRIPKARESRSHSQYSSELYK